ncbi:MAG: DUF4125 family protein [Bacillota bacterium]|nr:DUF4125 family protein [Bacillota bacterium]
MAERDEIIKQIISREWDMFSNVKSITGGKVSCQEDPRTFEIMRASNFMSYDLDVLESYLQDLDAAIKNGRNIVAEKYGWMMKSTMPDEFCKIEHMLPSPGQDQVELIDKIVQIELEWHKDLLEKYPYLIKRGRPLYSNEDSPSVTSVETYLRGELLTYSMTTLEKYYNNRLAQKKDNINGIKNIMLYMVQQYGYKSLEEANEKLRAAG